MNDTYRGHRIEVRLLPSGRDRWRTAVYVWIVTSMEIQRVKLPPAPSEWAATTQEAAHHAAVTQARAWIDLFA